MTNGPPAWRLRVHEALTSTSDLCRTLAEAGEPAGLAIQARRQTSGRGTHGRDWISPVGNLYLSLLLRPGGPVADAPQWGLLAAVAITEALTPLLPPETLRLKWPNDVLAGDGKIAGVLAEAAAGAAGRLDWLVLGLGVNLASAPDLPDRPATCVGPSAPDPEMFAADLLARLGAWHGVVSALGFAPVRNAWRALGPALGAAVAVRHGGQTHSGQFTGLGDDGSLRLSACGGVRAFVAGQT